MDKDLPLVTIICLCYNHSYYIDECIDSVLNQTYPNIEVILVDDKSTDEGKSHAKLKYYSQKHKWRYIANKTNLGNCKAFNKALHHASGDFVIDLATDDVLLPNRVLSDVNSFRLLDNSYAIVYSNATYIDENSNYIKHHHQIDGTSKAVKQPPSGYIFKEIIERYFICSPTVTTRTNYLKEIGGYNETISFEDWDFWLKLSRNYKFHYIDEVTTQKRVLVTSMSFSFFGSHSQKMHTSVLSICQQVFNMCRTPEEFDALYARVNYELKEAFLSGDMKLVPLFYNLIKRIKSPSFSANILLKMSYLNPRFIRHFYKWYRTKKAVQK